MKKLVVVLLVALFSASCSKHADIVIIISANAEWNAFSKIIRPADNSYRSSPYGKWFPYNIDGHKVIFFHGGWGKIDAAGSAQYVIDEFNPGLVINLGTAGGFPGKISKGDILLVNKAVTYDIYEKMGDSEDAINYYTSAPAVPVLEPDDNVKTSSLASADQDLFPDKIDMLNRKYGVIAGDWESSAIAHVAGKNNVKCYVVRGITDIVYPAGSNTYGNYGEFEKETASVMVKLVELLKKIIASESRSRI